MLTYDDLKSTAKELLAEAYQEHYPAQQTVTGQTRQRRQGEGNKSKLGRLEDKLLFILVYEKTYPL